MIVPKGIFSSRDDNSIDTIFPTWDWKRDQLTLLHAGNPRNGRLLLEPCIDHSQIERRLLLEPCIKHSQIEKRLL